ncbi:hypothetical protein [Streptomyces sp. NPDC127039]|uniref:hypothetical protein n=1 Tax=Streptomyces sp. NPDC127039 TaxID=3347115 RepID=UPI0036697C29
MKSAGVASVLGLATVAATVIPAGAATNVRGQEPFDTDRLLMTLCNGDTGMQEKLVNVDTGEVRSLTDWNDIRGRWERVKGHCSYPKASSWTWTGPEERVSDIIVNCSTRSDLRHDVTSSGSTTSTTTRSVSGSVGVDWTAIKDVLSFQAGAGYSHSWSYAKTTGWARTSSLTVPPRRVGWMVQRPEMRTVRSNPVFHVDAYTWNTLPFAKWQTVGSWRGRGYRDIKSHGAYYDAKANVTDGNGRPVQQIVARDRAVNSGDRC